MAAKDRERDRSPVFRCMRCDAKMISGTLHICPGKKFLQCSLCGALHDKETQHECYKVLTSDEAAVAAQVAAQKKTQCAPGAR